MLSYAVTVDLQHELQAFFVRCRLVVAHAALPPRIPAPGQEFRSRLRGFQASSSVSLVAMGNLFCSDRSNEEKKVLLDLIKTASGSETVGGKLAKKLNWADSV